MVLKALLLDLDGVITDTAKYHYLAWKNLAASIGIEINEEFNERLKGVSRMESLEIILASAGQKSRYNETEKMAFAAKKNHEYQETIKQLTSADIFPGLERLLDDARDAGIKLILCSASKNAPTILKYLKLTDHFDAAVDANKLINGKPDPEIFLTGAKLAGVKPDECIGIEDAVTGVEAIKAADDMIAVGVGNAELLAAADIVVQDTETLSIEFLQEIYKKYSSNNEMD